MERTPASNHVNHYKSALEEELELEPVVIIGADEDSTGIDRSSCQEPGSVHERMLLTD